MPPRAAAGITLRFHRAARRRVHPHLAPIDQVALRTHRDVVLEKASSLASYRRYLEQARAAKVQGRGASPAFERAVQVRARGALDDMHALGTTALQATQQLNQTGLWDQLLDRMRAGLQATGPLTARQIWDDLRAGDRYKVLRDRGFTDEMAAAMHDAIEGVGAKLVLRGGKPAVEARGPDNQPRYVMLGRMRAGPPASVAELLRRPRFDQIVSAFTSEPPAYLEVLASDQPIEHELGDLVAIAAVAGRQRLIDHVRKLEDTGLATYAGEDPVSVIAVIAVIGALAAIVSFLLLSECGPDDDPDATICYVGWFLAFLAVILLGGLGAALLLTGNPVLGGILLGIAGGIFADMMSRVDDLFGFEQVAG